MKKELERYAKDKLEQYGKDKIELEHKLEEKYKKEFQKLATSTSRIRVLEEQVRNCRSEVDIYEKQIAELEELFDWYTDLDGLNAECVELRIERKELHAELNELRSNHNKLKNHWLVKLFRL